MNYKIISGDSHIDLRWLPQDLFVDNVPAKWRDAAPQVSDTEHGKRWFAEGRDLASIPLGAVLASMELPKRGVAKRIDRMYEAGFFGGEPHPTDPELRIRDQEIDGVDAEVMYPILGLGSLLEDPELRAEVYRTYNTWVAGFCKADPKRFAALACIPNDDAEIAASELRRAAGLGLKGADFAVSTASRPIWHRHWDPLWAAADECGMPISFHTLGFPSRPPLDEAMAREYATEYRATKLTMAQFAGSEYLASIVFSGALERNPGLKFVLGECGATWIPHVLARMDEEYDDQFEHLSFSLKPSEYWRRQGYTTYQHDPMIASFVDLVGEDNILWGSDYPHPDGTWPDSLDVIEGDLGSLGATARRKITCENSGRLYGLLD